jgi:epoxyqueuosine reductase QueG
MEKITGRVKDLAKCYGAGVVGIVTTEMLAGGPPSTDLAYVLPNAKSAVSFAVPLDQKFIDSWFNKQSHADHLRNSIQSAVSAEEAKKRLTAMDAETRALYEEN